MLWIVVGVVATVTAGLVFQSWGARRDRRRVPPPGRLVSLGPDRRLHAQQRGNGTPTVVFEAGLAASSLTWSLVQPRVAAFTRTIAYDRAGLAWSDAARGAMTAGRLACDLRILLDAAAIPAPYVLVGHSFGSLVVRALASRHPADVSGLVLIDPVCPDDWTTMAWKARWRLRGGVWLAWLGAALARVGFVRACLMLLAGGATAVPKGVSRLFGSEAASLMSRMVGEVQKLPPAVWPAVQAHWSQPKAFASMARHLSSLRDSVREVKDSPEHLDSLPLVVITARSQSPGCLDEHRRLAAGSSRGRHVVVDGGHWIHLDDPALVAGLIREVVDAARAPGQGRMPAV